MVKLEGIRPADPRLQLAVRTPQCAAACCLVVGRAAQQTNRRYVVRHPCYAGGYGAAYLASGNLKLEYG